VPLDPGQLRRRQQVETVIRVFAPALNAVLAVGERVSRIAERDDVEYYPPRVSSEEPPRRVAGGDDGGRAE